MPVNHECFLEIAKDSASKNGEQWVRNTVSRAYYSMFHSALRLTDGHIPDKSERGDKLTSGTHKRLSDYLCDGVAASDFSLDVTETKKIGLALKTAHHKRVAADYKLNNKINKFDSLSTIKAAEDLDDKVNALLDAKKKVV